MPRLAETEARVANMIELQGIVGAVRSLAGMRMQEAQRTLPGIRRYAASIVQAIAITAPPSDEAPAPVDRARRALIVCASEHGFVGGFNERVLDTMQATLKSDDTLFILGSRGAALAGERIAEIGWTYPMATRADRSEMSSLIFRLNSTAALRPAILRGSSSFAPDTSRAAPRRSRGERCFRSIPRPLQS